MIEYFALFLCITAALTEQVCLLGFMRFPYVYGIRIGTISIMLPESDRYATVEERISTVSSKLSDGKIFMVCAIPDSGEVFIRETYFESRLGLLMLCCHIVVADYLNIAIRANTFTISFAFSLAVLLTVLGFSVLMVLGILLSFVVIITISYFRFRKYLYDRLGK